MRKSDGTLSRDYLAGIAMILTILWFFKIAFDAILHNTTTGN
jgi:hypothetical protein